MISRTLIVAGHFSGFEPCERLVEREVYSCVIWVDSALSLYLELSQAQRENLKTTRQVAIGDFDSFPQEDIPIEMEILKFPSDKDQSDLELALELAREGGEQNVLVLGSLASMGRPDHVLGNLLLLMGFARFFERLCLISPEAAVQAVVPGRDTAIEIPRGSTFSVFAPSGAEQVFLSGSHYDLEGENLEAGTRGLSNFALDSEIKIRTESGVLLVMIPAGR